MNKCDNCGANKKRSHCCYCESYSHWYTPPKKRQSFIDKIADYFAGLFGDGKQHKVAASKSTIVDKKPLPVVSKNRQKFPELPTMGMGCLATPGQVKQVTDAFADLLITGIEDGKFKGNLRLLMSVQEVEDNEDVANIVHQHRHAINDMIVPPLKQHQRKPRLRIVGIPDE